MCCSSELIYLQDIKLSFNCDYVNYIMRPEGVSVPQCFQTTFWTPKSNREQLHTWILQVIATEVKLPQLGVGAENWSKHLTALIFQVTARHAAKRTKSSEHHICKRAKCADGPITNCIYLNCSSLQIGPIKAEGITVNRVNSSMKSS